MPSTSFTNNLKPIQLIGNLIKLIDLRECEKKLNNFDVTYGCRFLSLCLFSDYEPLPLFIFAQEVLLYTFSLLLRREVFIHMIKTCDVVKLKIGGKVNN